MYLSRELNSRITGNIYGRKGGRLGVAKLTCGGRKTITLFDGAYEFADLKPATYTIDVRLKGFQSESKKVVVKGGETKTLNFYLNEAGGSAKIHGYVYDAVTGKPVSSVGTVILILPVANRYAVIDKNGHFEFKDLPADTYEVWASVQGYSEEKTTVTLAEDETKKIDFRCRAELFEEPPWG